MTLLMTFIKHLFHISLISMAMFVLIFLIRAVFGKRLPAKYVYILWLVFLIRLMFPLSISSQFSVENIYEKPFEYLNEDQILVENNSVSDQVITYGSLNREIYRHDRFIDKVLEVSVFIWIFGVFCVMFIPIISYITLKKALLDDEDARDKVIDDIMLDVRMKVNEVKIPIKFSYYLDAPALIGVFRPIIILPYGLKDADRNTLYPIILHEMVHYKKNHLLLQWLFWIVKAIYWFNPVIWLAHEWMKLDAELACDDTVMKLLEEDMAKNYGHVLIDIADHSDKSPYAINAAGLINKDSELKKRIIRLMNSKKPSKFLSLITVALAIIMLPVFFTTVGMEDILPLNYVVARMVSDDAQQMDVVSIRFVEYDFDSSEESFLATMELELDKNFVKNLPERDYMEAELELYFPRSFDPEIRNQKIRGTNDIGNSSQGLYRFDVEFKVEDYEPEKFDDPVLVFTGLNIEVSFDELVIEIDEELVPLEVQLDDFMTYSVHKASFRNEEEAKFEFSLDTEYKGQIWLHDNYEVYDSSDKLISTSGMGISGLENNYSEVEINYDSLTDDATRIRAFISGYNISIGEYYHNINETKVSWDIDLKSHIKLDKS